MNLFLAATPIIIVIAGVAGFKKPEMWASVGALIYTLILGTTYFKVEMPVAFDQTTNGVVEGAKMVFMIWAAFLILNMLIHTGAMEKIKEIIVDFCTRLVY